MPPLPRHGVDRLLKTIGAMQPARVSKPLKEPEDVMAPPMSDSEEEEFDSVQHYRDSSDDDSQPARGDMGRTNFIPKKTSTPADGARGYGGMKATSKTAEAPRWRSARPQKKRAMDDVEDAEAGNSDAFNPGKKARTSGGKGSSSLGSHMGDGFLVERRRKPQKAMFGKKARNMKNAGSSRESTPRRNFEKHSSMSASPSPEKAKFKATRLDFDLSSPAAPKPKPLNSSKAQDHSESSELSEVDSSVCSDPPQPLKGRRKEKPNWRQPSERRRKNVKESTPEDVSQRSKFKMPEGYDDFATQNELAHVDMSTCEDLQRGQEADLGPDKALCPMCDEPVDKDWLNEFSKNQRMSIARQAKFCHMHKKRSAKDIWAARKYPEIDWGTLESRIAAQHDFLESLINGETSHYGDVHRESINTGKNRTLLKTEDYPTPGYYGLRGMSVMTETIVEMFSALLRERAPRYKLISARGYTGFVQSVLVPELAVKLIQEDMSLGDEEAARVVMEESRAIGEIIHDEKKESRGQMRGNIGGGGQGIPDRGKEPGSDGKASGGGEDVSVALRIQEIDDSDSDLSSLASSSGKQVAAGRVLEVLDSDSELSSLPDL
ncbi:hypothetical protein VSDG_04700 [Cytospora chrysosperma]|uniref:Restriction of telomere capping protein 4 n=1 Tax=Cytospora chrysosperma TaxID=252740 RepID=A0A423W1V9_CYTCH|nr:hypothetical protein VSDG_04700 [Valsa sordida]